MKTLISRRGVAAAVLGAIGCLAALAPVWGGRMAEARPLDPPPADRAIAAVLNDFHDAASKADGKRYFAHFAPEGVFLGTDATERWNVEQFRAYAQPYFDQGKGWTYVPRPATRIIHVARGGETAWFDELLDNESYGECRGSGVLVRVDGAWRVAQYNLSVPVPNDLLKEVVARIREFKKK